MALSGSNSQYPAGMPRAMIPFALILLWTAVGLFFASAGGSVKQALTTWYLWGLLAWVMVAIDRRLPVPQERLGWRLLCHVPLSLLFSVLYICLTQVVDAALRGALPQASQWQKVVR